MLTLGLGVTMAAYSAGTDGGSVFLGYLVLIPVWLIVAVPTYLIGLTVIGLPAWAIVERLGVRSRTAAVVIGAGLSTTTTMIPQLAVGLNQPEGLAWAAILQVLSGAAAGWTLHRVAYGREVRP